MKNQKIDQISNKILGKFGVFARLVFIELVLAAEESSGSANRRVNIVIRGFMREITVLKNMQSETKQKNFVYI